MSQGPCKKCSGYPLEVIAADNMDIDRACLCFDPEGFVYSSEEQTAEEEN